jgi:hemoglobin
MKDITNITDIQILVDTFYDKVRADDTIGPIFNDVANVNWEEHLPKMYRFWESIIFGAASYKGNPMLTHLTLSERTPMNNGHFIRWIELWTATVDQNFLGPNADLTKKRADGIRQLMLYKIEQHQKSNSLI